MSRTEARRLIKDGAVDVDGQPMSFATVIPEGFHTVRVGKKTFSPIWFATPMEEGHIDLVMAVENGYALVEVWNGIGCG